jgi:hypothetical protein
MAAGGYQPPPPKMNINKKRYIKKSVQRTKGEKIINLICRRKKYYV